MAAKDFSNTVTNGEEKPPRPYSSIDEKTLVQDWSWVVTDPMTVCSNTLVGDMLHSASVILRWTRSLYRWSVAMQLMVGGHDTTSACVFEVSLTLTLHFHSIPIQRKNLTSSETFTDRRRFLPHLRPPPHLPSSGFCKINLDATAPMDIHLIQKLLESQASLTQTVVPVFLPDELIMEIISLLDVKIIQRFMCVSKSWNTLISDKAFIEMHLKKPSRNPHFILPIMGFPLSSSIVLPVQQLLENHAINFAGDTDLSLEICDVVGSCNGLLCLLFHSTPHGDYEPGFCPFKFCFGCDYLTGTYKVVVLHTEHNKDRKRDDDGDVWISKVRVFSLGDNCWRRDIQTFPLAPLLWSNGVHLSGTVNWLAIRGAFTSTYDGGIIRVSLPVKQLVIVSLNLSTETYTEFLLHEGFVELPRVEP
ncbi:unnamed protein product [Vicia faba]|uniref:F-box domain-containing protein n=1 Tax=Vicia faba TaxID=3906 RepID=A0AAV0ZVX2_VICFA|nr:unnamed protein product [Vicia faba]